MIIIIIMAPYLGNGESYEPPFHDFMTLCLRLADRKQYKRQHSLTSETNMEDCSNTPPHTKILLIVMHTHICGSYSTHTMTSSSKEMPNKYSLPYDHSDCSPNSIVRLEKRRLNLDFLIGN